MEKDKIKGVIEAILFAAGREVKISELMSSLELGSEDIINAVESLKLDYDKENRGLSIINLNDAYQLCTKKEYYEYIYPIFDKRNKPNLSNAALETLSIIAYNPRITRAEIESIRGVNSDGTIYKLLDYDLIEEAGKLDAPGRPTTYKTTNEFLKMFGMSSLDELPDLPRYKLDENKQIVIDEIIENIEEAPMPEREELDLNNKENEENNNLFKLKGAIFMKNNENKKEFVKEITNIEEDFAQWYTDIVLKAELADYTAVKGFITIKPYGYAIWENIQKYADDKFKERGVKNLSMPVLIPESLLEKEKEHVEGFAPEVAWVTMGGGEELEERLCIRPTSETIFSTMYSKWLSSWRDLPYLYNQWCNVLRWEKETRPFLRSREFLWQEGHTIHETAEEAKEFTLEILEIYADVIENLLAIPVLKGRKTKTEQFAGAEATYTVETLMHDGRALQGGTSHYFGQNFSKPFDIKFQNREGKEEYAYQTSWGISTRLIGAVIMAHGDNRGLKLPPRVAPIQVVIVPVAAHKEGVKEKAEELYKILQEKYRVELDLREQYSPGYKFNDWEMKGVPVRIEIGPRDIEAGKCVVVRRDTLEKIEVNLNELSEKLNEILEEIQKNMYDICVQRVKDKTTIAHNMDEFVNNLNTNQGYVKAMWCGDAECEDKIHEMTGAKSRCIPFEQEHLGDKCVYCGKPTTKMVVWGRQY